MHVWTSLRPPVRGTVIMVVVAALVLALVGAGKNWIDGTGREDPGRLPDSAEVVGDEDTVNVLIPSGRVNVTVETGQHTLRGDDDMRLQAPSGGRLVEAGWTHDSDDPSTGGADERPAGLEPDKMPDPVVWVKSGDQRERVTGSSEGIGSNAQGGAFAFGNRDPLVVEVEFAGRRQSVEVTSGRRTVGSFASLYSPSAPATASARGFARGQRKGDVWWSSTLAVAYDRVPYLHDLGWAKKGREWLVLGQTEYAVDGFEGLGSDNLDAFFSVSDSKPVGSVRVGDGRAARKPTALARGGFSKVRYAPTGAVFDIPRGKGTALTFTLKLRLKRSEGHSSTSKPFTASRVEPLSNVLQPAATDR